MRAAAENLSNKVATFLPVSHLYQQVRAGLEMLRADERGEFSSDERGRGSKTDDAGGR